MVEKISVKNFASYERAELDLRTLGRTVSIQGPTGAGKTTFFVDAVTFALFGRAYGEMRAESLGWVAPPSCLEASEVTVDLRVMDELYRVVRRVRVRGGSAKAEARMDRIDESGKVIKTVAIGVRGVDELVERLTGLDYLTFLNTVVVRQGEVAELLSKDMKPADRREVFLRAFGIDFKKQKEVARRLFNERDKELGRLEERVRELEKEASKKADVLSKLEEGKRGLEEKRKESSRIELELEELRGEAKKLELEKAEVERLLAAYQERRRRLDGLRKELADVSSCINELEARVKAIEEVRREQRRLKDDKARLEEALPIVNDVEQERSRLEELERSLKGFGDVRAKFERQKRRVKELEEESEGLALLEEALTKRSEELEREKGLLNGERGKLELLKRNLEALRNMKVDSCPVCRRPLGEKEREDALLHLKDEYNEVERRISELSDRTKGLREEVEEAQKRLAICKEASAKLPEAKEQLKSLEEQLASYQELAQRVEESKERLSKKQRECEAILGEAPPVKELKLRLDGVRRTLDEVEERLRGLERDEDELKRTRDKMSRLEDEVFKLEQELKDVPKLEERRRALKEGLEELEEKLKEGQKEKEELSKKIGSLEEVIRGLEAELKSVEDAERNLKELNAKMEEASDYKKAYELLYNEVFHERGLPVALLKEFLEAVEVWSKEYVRCFLPDKDIRFEVDEEGRVVIKVLDGTNERDLATYSGGEATLIGFSVRLGIAKAIAERRLMTNPRFLIIDEGFGPLSREFREDVLKHLRDLSKEYEQILVISHVDDVKDSPYFVGHLVVARDRSGLSQIQVMKPVFAV